MAVRWSRAVPAATSLIVLIAAAALYSQFIPVSHVERTRLAGLLIVKPPAGMGTKPNNSSEVAAASSPFTGVQAAGKRSPNATGSYTAEWVSPASANDIDQVLASLLPSEADANSVLTEADSMYLTSKSVPQQGYTFKGPFAVPGVPGAHSAQFSTTTSGQFPLGVVVFRVKQVVVVTFAQQTTEPAATASAVAISAAEYQHLVKVAPGFSLVRTTRPLVASIVYALGAVVAAVAVGCLVVVLAWWFRRRRAREAARLEAIRQARDRDRRKRAARHSD